MHRPKIFVAGATGKTGAAVVSQLRAANWPVRALIHRRDGRSTALDAIGAETVVGDLFESESLLDAMQGCKRAYYAPPFHPFMIHSATAFAIAAHEARLEAIIGMSQWLAAPEHPSLLTRQSLLADRLLSMVPGAAHVTVDPGYFADNYLRLIDFAALLGIFPNLNGMSSNAPPSNEDIARVVVSALTDPQRHAGRSYRPTGPELLDANRIASILSRVLGRKVRTMPMPYWLFVKAARMQGVDAFDLHSLRYYIEDHRQGAFAFGAPNNDVFEATGRSPESFETIAHRYAVLPKAQPSMPNRLRAMCRFLATPFAPGYDLKRYETVHRHPQPSEPQLAMHNPQWLASHATGDRYVPLTFQPTQKSGEAL